MTEPTEPKPEYKLSDEAFAKIHLVDFRLNSVMTVLLAGGTRDWTNEKLKALQQYFRQRGQAIEDNKFYFLLSGDPVLKELGQASENINRQLIALSDVISYFLRNHDFNRFVEDSEGVYQQMRPATTTFTNNKAYQAYKARVQREDLEATRNHFEYDEASGSGE